MGFKFVALVKRTKSIKFLCFTLVFTLFYGCNSSKKDSPEAVKDVYQDQFAGGDARQQPINKNLPNILIIIVDDLGFNDLGIFGGEIDTPNIDSLAQQGVLFTNFHATPNCSPTRAMLLSGVDNHIAGLGNMGEALSENQKDKPGYEGYLNFKVVALPERLKKAGYKTYMAGKWHLGLTKETGPMARGFDESFALLQGGAGAFSNRLSVVGPGKALYQENGNKVERLPEDFYSTRFYTKKIISYIDKHLADDKPFFSYLAYTAPHWPLQAPRESISKYNGVYDDGYDSLHESRLSRAKKLGFINDNTPSFPRLLDEPPWDDLSELDKKYQARTMEIYAAMVDDVDKEIGRLITYLKNIEEYQNTVIFFMSDNGPEGHQLGKDMPPVFDQWAQDCCDNSYENIGNANSYVMYGPSWARAGNAPHRMFKGFTGQGGVVVPAFFHYPDSFAVDQKSNALLHVTDIVPTILDITGTSIQTGKKFNGRDVVAVQGRSILPLLMGQKKEIHSEDDYIAWELFGKRAVRKGHWKIVYLPHHTLFESRIPFIKTNFWQLYNLEVDPTESNDLAKEFPIKLAELVGLWDQYVVENGVIIPPTTNAY